MTKYITFNGQHWRLRIEHDFLSFRTSRNGTWELASDQQEHGAIALLVATGMATVSDSDPTQDVGIQLARYE